jgi:hypothetical protein
MGCMAEVLFAFWYAHVTPPPPQRVFKINRRAGTKKRHIKKKNKDISFEFLRITAFLLKKSLHLRDIFNRKCEQLCGLLRKLVTCKNFTFFAVRVKYFRFNFLQNLFSCGFSAFVTRCSRREMYPSLVFLQYISGIYIYVYV